MLKRTLITLVAAAFLTSCAAPPSATVEVLVAAESSKATKVKRIAVLPFDGDQNRTLTSDIESLLTNVKVGDQPFFLVVERDRIEKISKEIKFSQSGQVTKESAKKVGKTLGADALYTGNVAQPQTHTNAYKEKRSVCVQESEPKGKLKLKSCLRSEERTVNCSTTEAVFSFTPKLIDVQSAEILFSEKIIGNAQDSSCDDKGSASRTAGQLLAAARESALAQFIRKVAPTSSKRDLQLMDSTTGIKNELAIKKINQGLDFAKGGRMDRACEFWQEASALAPEEITIIYNLAVCAEMEGKMDIANAAYIKVDRRLEKPDARVTAALKRMKEAQDNAAKLIKQTTTKK